MSQNYSLSVLASVHDSDCPKLLEICLESLFHQSLYFQQLVVVQDGPLNCILQQVLDKYSILYSNIIRLKNKECMGLGYSLKLGLNSCTCDLVARIDSDDICYPYRFNKQISYFKENSNLDIIGSWATEIDNDGNVIKDRTVPLNDKDIKAQIWCNPIIHPSVMFKRLSILKIGSYKNLKYRQDYELWFRASYNNLTFQNIPEPLIYYRTTRQHFKKYSIKVSILMAYIGLIGCFKNNLKIICYFGVLYPLFKLLIPVFVRNQFENFSKKYDPRNF
jgi:glycosyltransferase involved in cell wall biosynthesis